jgi:hypothetical protein
MSCIVFADVRLTGQCLCASKGDPGQDGWSGPIQERQYFSNSFPFFCFHPIRLFLYFHSAMGETEVRINQLADFLQARNSQIFQPRFFAGFFHFNFLVRVPVRLPLFKLHPNTQKRQYISSNFFFCFHPVRLFLVSKHTWSWVDQNAKEMHMS